MFNFAGIGAISGKLLFLPMYLAMKIVTQIYLGFKALVAFNSEGWLLQVELFLIMSQLVQSHTTTKHLDTWLPSSNSLKPLLNESSFQAQTKLFLALMGLPKSLSYGAPRARAFGSRGAPL